MKITRPLTLKISESGEGIYKGKHIPGAVCRSSGKCVEFNPPLKAYKMLFK